ncbi:MAG: metallophosphoesterase family protein [Halothece sp.]
MRLKRRQFLLLSTSFASFSLATLIHQGLIKPDNSDQNSPVSVDTPTTPAPKEMQAPVRGDVRIVIISDLNSQYGSTDYEPEVDQAIALIPNWQPDLVLCGGDMIAAQKRSLSSAQIEQMWFAFDQHIAEPLRKAKIPFGFTLGNHDGSGALSSQGDYLFNLDRELASDYWNTPAHDPNLPFIDRANFPFYYTFRQNNIYYLVWDASTARISPEQLAWVEKSLASPTAQNAKMRILIGHLPLYAVAVGRDKPGEVLESPEQLRSLLERYSVHTYISGHHHAYYPGHRGQLDLLYTGALGSGPRQLLNSDLSPQNTLTVVDVDLDAKSTVYTTYDMKTLQVIDSSTLPSKITSHNGWVVRRDLANQEF